MLFLWEEVAGGVDCIETTATDRYRGQCFEALARLHVGRDHDLVEARARNGRRHGLTQQIDSNHDAALHWTAGIGRGSSGQQTRKPPYTSASGAALRIVD